MPFHTNSRPLIAIRNCHLTIDTSSFHNISQYVTSHHVVSQTGRPQKNIEEKIACSQFSNMFNQFTATSMGVLRTIHIHHQPPGFGRFGPRPVEHQAPLPQGHLGTELSQRSKGPLQCDSWGSLSAPGQDRWCGSWNDHGSLGGCCV